MATNSDLSKILNSANFQIYESPYEIFEEAAAVLNSEEFKAKSNYDRLLETMSYANQALVEEAGENPEGKPYNWFGFDPTKGFKEQMDYTAGAYNTYLDPDIKATYLESFSSINSQIDMGGELTKSKLKANPRNGIFSFDLASKGLVRPTEFYNPELDSMEDPILVDRQAVGGVVQYVRKIKDKNGKVTKTYLLERQQEGTQRMLEEDPTLRKVFFPKLEMSLPLRGSEKINKITTPKGVFRLRYTSTEKKVYLERESLGGGVAKYVDLFLVIGGLGDMTAESMAVKNLPMIIVAQLLERAGVRTRIYATRAVLTNGLGISGRNVMAAINIKDYGEPFNLDKVLTFTSDPRFFRYSLWNTLPASMYARSGEALEGAGTTLYGYNRGQRDALYPLFAGFKNWVFNNKGGKTYRTKITDPDLMILGGMQRINGESTFDNSEEDILNEVYRIADYVSLMLSKKPRDILRKIKSREEERVTTLANRDESYIKNYLLRLIEDSQLQVPPNLKDVPAEYRATPARFEQSLNRRIELYELIRDEFPEVTVRVDKLINESEQQAESQLL